MKFNDRLKHGYCIIIYGFTMAIKRSQQWCGSSSGYKPIVVD